MEKSIEPLIEAITKDGAKQPVSYICFDETIAVEEMDSLPLILGFMPIGVNTHPNSILEKRSEGKIVISGQIVNVCSAFHQTPKLTKDLKVVGADGVAVFDPEIKKIAQYKEVGSLLGNASKKACQILFSMLIARNGGSDVGIRDKEN